MKYIQQYEIIISKYERCIDVEMRHRERNKEKAIKREKRTNR